MSCSSASCSRLASSTSPLDLVLDVACGTRSTILRGALPGRKPATYDWPLVTSSLYFSPSRSSMSPRSTVTLMCFLQGPMSVISTVWLSLTGSVLGRGGGGVRSVVGGVVGVFWVVGHRSPGVRGGPACRARLAPSGMSGLPSKKAGRMANGKGPSAILSGFQQERAMGLEPTTPTLATWPSTTELHPRSR